MRRALDLAILELGASNDRDKILDAFFEYAKTLFDFSVLLVVKGTAAHGRSVHGLGAPPGLVSRLVLPIDGRGILAQARDLRKPFVAQSSHEEADQTLFGHLGRALPSPLVVPLVVRDRVVAIFLGETVAASVAARATESGRPALQLAQDEMLLLAEAAGQVLERLILRKKGSSIPPPALGLETPLFPPAPSTGFEAPRPKSIFPPANTAIQFAPANPLPAPPEPERRSRRGPLLLAGAVAAVALLGVVAWKALSRTDPAREVVFASGQTLKGWPGNVAPVQAIDAARAASGLTGNIELGAIDAEVTNLGVVDFQSPPRNSETVLLRFELVSGDTKSDVIIDQLGVHHGRLSPRARCGDELCRSSVPAPECAYTSIIDAAKSAGLGDGDRPFIRYAAPDGGGRSAEWVVSVAGRGSIRLDAKGCKPLPRERLRPPALPLEKIPGAPQVDPIAILALVRAQSGLEDDATLLEIDARGVNETGRVDLTTADATLVYTFAEPVAQKRRRWRQVVVRHDGMPIVSDEGDIAPLPARLHGTAVPKPRCTFGNARTYMTRGMDSNAPAHMIYGPDPAFQNIGQWSLEIANLPSRRTVSDLDCEMAPSQVRNDRNRR